MKQLYKAALLAALGFAGVTLAQAGTTDLILGFTDAGGPSPAQNDDVIDIGAASLFTTTSTAGGVTGNLDANGTLASIYDGTGGDTSYLNDLSVGVVEGNEPQTPHTLFQTSVTALTGTPTKSVWNGAASDASTTAVGEYTSASGESAQTGWSYLIAQSSTQNGTSTTPANLASVSKNPMQTLSDGVITETLYESLSTGSGLSQTEDAWTEIGTFDINANSDTWTFNGVDATPVPEPAAYGLLGGAGLLILALRRQFITKIA